MMNKQLAEAFRNRWGTVARVQEEESRVSTLEQRWRETNAILGLALGLKLPLDRDQSEAAVRQRWARLKREQAL